MLSNGSRAWMVLNPSAMGKFLPILPMTPAVISAAGKKKSV